jgi:hypothetical protein
MKMYPYLRNESEREEFNEVFDVASRLFSKRRKTVEKAKTDLINLGKKAVRATVYTIECTICSDSFDELGDEIEEFAMEIEEILMGIGKDALPDLEDFATNGGCNIYVNEFAQEMIFKIMGLSGKARQKVCHHDEKILLTEGEKKLWECVLCDAKFECKKGDKVGKMID